MGNAVRDTKKNISDAIAKCEDIVEGLDTNRSKDNLDVAPPRLCQNSSMTDRLFVVEKVY